ncbi:MAG: response regulator [Anaerolineae bacterium]|nr:response regulator [Anaerolineae bacterium]
MERLALIIEDEPKLADIFSLALMPDFEVKVVNDGQSALNILADIAPAIILLDLHLPRVSGTDILRHIKADERLKQSRIIITTADALMAEDLRDQADIVLLKPISVNQLNQLANRLCIDLLGDV